MSEPDTPQQPQKRTFAEMMSYRPEKKTSLKYKLGLTMAIMGVIVGSIAFGGLVILFNLP